MLSNLRQFSRNEDLEERWLEIDFKAESYEGIRITKTDSDGGIPKEVRGNIFDSLFI